MNPTRWTSLAVIATATLLGGCIRHQVDPIEVKPVRVEPIHITVDVNVRVDRELDEFFDFQEQAPTPVPVPVPAPVPAPAPTQP